ncbi:MAG: hypothetical protein JEZ12_15950 [Desulfobacterium sp.]|nr:hypothetical protein [Desulfobacterium sp.]
MDWLDSWSKGLDWVGDNKDAISTVGNLALGGYGLYESHKAGETAANFYDAAGETAEERWEMLKPYEEKNIDHAMWQMDQARPLEEQAYENQAQELDLNALLLDYQAELLPQQMDFQTELLNFQTSFFPQQAEAARERMFLDRTAMQSEYKDIEQYEKYRPIADEFYQQSLDGIDPGQESDKAQADVAHAFASTMEAASRELARRGVGPDNAGYQGKANDNAVEQAKAIGSARTGARKYAEDVNYNRLSSALNARERLAPAQTGAITTPTGSVLPNPTGSQVPTAQTPSGANPTNTYLALGNTAAQGASTSSDVGWDLVQRGLNG